MHVERGHVTICDCESDCGTHADGCGPLCECECRTCIFGDERLSEGDHAAHMHIIDALTEALVPGIENVLVHSAGVPDRFDADGVPYLCDRHFVASLAVLQAGD